MRKNNVLFINGRFLTQPITGVQRYAHEILNRIDTLITQRDISIPSGFKIICLVPRNLIEEPLWHNIKIKKVGLFLGNLWEQIDLPLFVKDGFLFSPTNIGPFFVSKQVVTIHDASVFAIPEAYSKMFVIKYRLTFLQLGRSAKKIISVSNFSKQELINYCHIPPQKICVIHHGHEHLLDVDPDISVLSRNHLGEKPFFLTVGSNSIHKNLNVILDALKHFKNDEFNLVIAGGNFKRVFQETNIEVPSNVIQLGYVTDNELRSLYENALAFIFPSKYEGFGLPVLEALSFGCPVICSNAASLTEVGGDAVTYFDPNDARKLEMEMEKILRRTLTGEELNLMKVHLSKFTWKESVLKTFSIIRESMEKNW